MIENNWYNQTSAVIKSMKDGGVKFLAGTDFPNPYCYPGYSLHEELRLFVDKGGLTPLEALQTATLNPAIYLNKEKEIGTVEVKKNASLLLLQANPLININNTKKIEGVILRGKYFSSKWLQDNLDSVVVKDK